MPLTFNYNSAIAQVRELRDIARQMRTLSSQSLESAITGAGNSWKGQSATRFLAKCRELKSQAETEANSIDAVANSLERSANAIAEAERRAAEIARRVLLGV